MYIARPNRVSLAREQLHAADPCSGAAVFVKPNENVVTGTPVVRLNCGNQPEVSVAMPDVFIDNVEVGAKVTIVFPALSGKTFIGTITEVGLASTEGTSTYPVTTRLNAPDPGIRSGMAADVMFTTDSDSDIEHYTVPSVAVGEDMAGRFVFILSPVANGHYQATRRAVEISDLASPAQSLRTESGLRAEELITRKGQGFFIHQMVSWKITISMKYKRFVIQ